MIGNKGQIWTEWISGLAILFAITVIFIILNQIYVNTFYDDAVTNGVDATNLNIIDLAWEWWPIPIVLAILFGMLGTGMRVRSGVEY